MNLKELKQNENGQASKPRNLFNNSDKSNTNISFSLDEKQVSRKSSSLNSFEVEGKKKKRHPVLKKFLLVLLLIAIIAASYGGYFYYQRYMDLKNTGIQDVNLLDPLSYAINAAVPNQKKDPLADLKQTNGRTNFLLLGVDARYGFSDSYRTDSIIVASYNHETNEVVEMSIPRDMQAKYYNSITKINAIFQFSYNEKKQSKATEEETLNYAFSKLTAAVKDVTDLDIHYGIMINFRGLKDVVDTLGGITVDVDTPLFDNLYPNDTDTGVITINFPKGVTQMNGTRALQYARSRETTTDFDRARRQQKVINAIKDKFLASNFFTEASKVNDLISIISKNVKFFNITSSTTQTLIGGKDLLKDLATYNVVLDPNIGSSVNSVLKGGQPIEGAGYLVYPADGKFTTLQAIVKMYNDNPKLLSEDANVTLIWTNNKRYKDFQKIGGFILDKDLPFIMRYDLIKVTVSTPSGTTTTTPTTTPTSTTLTATIYTSGNSVYTSDFYKKLLTDNSVNVIVKPLTEAPEELQKNFKDVNVLITVD